MICPPKRNMAAENVLTNSRIDSRSCGVDRSASGKDPESQIRTPCSGGTIAFTTEINATLVAQWQFQPNCLCFFVYRHKPVCCLKTAVHIPLQRWKALGHSDRK